MSSLQPLILYSYLRTRYRRRFRTRAELLAWQAGQVERHLQRVVPRSPFYRDYFQDRPLSTWPTAPLVNKAALMARFDDWNTAGLRREAAEAVALRAEQSRDFTPTINTLTVGLSSGTSGNRGLFLVSPVERARWAGAILARALPDPLYRPQRVAFFLRANSNLYTAVQARHIQFWYFDLLDPLEQHLERLDAFQPSILVAPPSVLRALAQARATSAVRFRPRRVIAVAEVLDPLDEAYIRQRFGQPVHQIYQATEGFLGCTCPHGVLHLMEDIVAIRREPLAGAPGKFSPIITDFNRVTQPIINYRLDDILTERAAPCGCGSVFTALESIEGRCDDVFILAKPGGGWTRAYPDFIRRAIITSSPLIDAYRARQHQPDQLEISFTAPPAQTADIEQRIHAALEALCAQLGGGMPQLRFTPLEAPAGPRKLKRVERLFAWPE